MCLCHISGYPEGSEPHLKSNWSLKIKLKKKNKYLPSRQTYQHVFCNNVLLIQKCMGGSLRKSSARTRLSKNFEEVMSFCCPFLLFTSFSLPFPNLYNFHAFERKTFYTSTVHIEVQKVACGTLSPTFSGPLTCLCESVVV